MNENKKENVEQIYRSSEYTLIFTITTFSDCA